MNSRISGFPGSTEDLTIKGVVHVSLIKTASNVVKIYFSVGQGSYEFKANEAFSENVSRSKTTYCCCITTSAESSESSMSIHYKTTSTVLSQDCIVPVQDCVIDAMVYKKAKNAQSLSVSSEGKGSTTTGVCPPCPPFCDCSTHYFGYLKLCYMCQTSQYRCNPLYNFIDCEMICKVCDSCSCVKKSGIEVTRKVEIDASDRFDLGSKYKYVEKNPSNRDDIADGPEWKNCPCFCCGPLCQYPVPLDFGDFIFAGAVIPYCLYQKPKIHDKDGKLQLAWSENTESENEIVVTVHYRHLIDKKVKSMKIVIRPEPNEQVDKVYQTARKFVSLISEYRQQLGLSYNEYEKAARTTISTSDGDKKSGFSLPGGLSLPFSLPTSLPTSLPISSSLSSFKKSALMGF